jgi:DNA-binding XRE family transcriptional regulator
MLDRLATHVDDLTSLGTQEKGIHRDAASVPASGRNKSHQEEEGPGEGWVHGGTLVHGEPLGQWGGRLYRDAARRARYDGGAALVRMRYTGESPALRALTKRWLICHHSNVLIRLREWRQRREMSLRALAARAGVAHVTIVRIEAGQMSPTVALLARLARALDLHISDLFPPKRPPRTKSHASRRTPKGA